MVVRMVSCASASSPIDEFGGAEIQARMGIAMVADLMPGGGDLRGRRRAAATFLPHMKKVAGTLCAARTSSSAGVDSLGPSSKVSASEGRDAIAAIDRGSEEGGGSSAHGISHVRRLAVQSHPRGAADERVIQPS